MVGFPHSEIPGSKLIRSSPRLIAAYYVLHRLHTPRHPLDALKTLDRSHYPYPQHHHPRQALVPAQNSVVGMAPRPAPYGTGRSDLKKPLSHVLICASPRVSGQTEQTKHLSTMSKQPATGDQKIKPEPNLLSDATYFFISVR